MKTISIEIVQKLIQTKLNSGFTGKIALVFETGVLTNVEKTQDMNNQRIAREVKRDENSIKKLV